MSEGRNTALLLAILLFTGISWGLTISLATIATSTGIAPMTVAFWAALIGAVLLTGVIVVRGKRVVLDREHITFYAVTGFVGTAFPHALSFWVAMYMPAGNRAIIYALIPMITLGISIALAIEKASFKRFIGIALGLAAMLIMLLPGAHVPLPDELFWTLMTLIIALSYAVENVYVGLRRPQRLDGLTALWGMTTAGALMLVPAIVVSGAPVLLPFRFDIAEGAILLSTLSHLLAYSGLLYMINNGGVVFGSQVSYIVTPAAIVWGIILLAEPLTVTISVSLVLIMAGLALIKPNPRKKVPPFLKRQFLEAGAVSPRCDRCRSPARLTPCHVAGPGQRKQGSLDHVARRHHVTGFSWRIPRLFIKWRDGFKVRRVDGVNPHGPAFEFFAQAIGHAGLSVLCHPVSGTAAPEFGRLAMPDVETMLTMSPAPDASSDGTSLRVSRKVPVAAALMVVLTA
jgi:drug/metabolite transporter (DMT)-like permease